MTFQMFFQNVALFLFTCIILPLIPYLVIQLTPVIKVKVQQDQEWLKAHMTARQWDLAVTVAGLVVRGIEQLKKNGVIPDNKTALAMGCKWLDAWLRKGGLVLPTDQLEQVIEVAVNQMNTERDNARTPATIITNSTQLTPPSAL